MLTGSATSTMPSKMTSAEIAAAFARYGARPMTRAEVAAEKAAIDAARKQSGGHTRPGKDGEATTRTDDRVPN